MTALGTIEKHGGMLFQRADGSYACPRCGWDGVPTIIDGVRQTECPVCETGAETMAMWENRAELFDPKTIRRERPKVGRNDPCPCGSGKKTKKCHPEYAA